MTDEKPKSKHANLIARVGVAIVAAPILLLAMYQDDPEYAWALVFPASLIAMSEFFAMTLADKTDRWASLAIGTAAVGILYWVPLERQPYLLAMFVATVPSGLYYVFRFGDMQTAATRVASTVTGIVYAGLLFTFVALIKRDGGRVGGDLLLLVLLTPWISDTGAYFAGRAFGKKKLYPTLSPGKTWAGGLGGLAGAFAATAALKVLRIEEMQWVDVAIISIVGGVLCQLGDLFESLIKRSTGVKDSGSILPGHGGILDRVDAVLFFAPFVYLYLTVTA